ncbi:MAG: hypothetical protein AB7S44_04095 [Spirochaetales bacterium]
MEKFNLIIPILNKSFDLNNEVQKLKGFFEDSMYDVTALFVAYKEFEKPKNHKDSDNYKLIQTDKETVNEVITEGFKHIDGNLIIVDMENEDWDEILLQILKKANEDNIILTRYVNKKAKVKNFFVRILKMIYHRYLKFFNLSSDFLSLNTFQYFNKDAVKVINKLPEKNTYMRNFDTFVGYEVQFVELNKKPLKSEAQYFKKAEFVVGFALSIVSVLALLFLIIFNQLLLALANGFTYYILSVMITLMLLFVGGYLMIKRIIKNRANLGSQK